MTRRWRQAKRAIADPRVSLVILVHLAESAITKDHRDLLVVLVSRVNEVLRVPLVCPVNVLMSQVWVTEFLTMKLVKY